MAFPVRSLGSLGRYCLSKPGRSLPVITSTSRVSQSFSTSRILCEIDTTSKTTATANVVTEGASVDAGVPAATIIPFSTLPYQCFQEARKFLALDRENTLKQITDLQQQITRLSSSTANDETNKADQLEGLNNRLERLVIQADMNDPVVKLEFEQGKGDMSKPVYRYMANDKWRSYRRLLAIQAIERMHVIPDVLPEIDPDLDVQILFGESATAPGAFVPSQESEAAPTLKIQSFSGGERRVSIVVVNSDVPDLATDSFTHRCHFLAVNIPLIATSPMIQLSQLDQSTQVVHAWLPPFALNGAPYHRFSVFVLDQPAGVQLDVEGLRQSFKRERFSLRNLTTAQDLQPSGTAMFRTIWDEKMKEVMTRNGIHGSDLVFKRKKPEKLPYKKKDSKRYR